MKVKIGITGASGMLGTALVVHLSKEYKIFATSRSKGVEGENIEWDCFNLTNATLLNSWLENVNPDIVIHCAAIVDVDLCEENPLLTDYVHYKTMLYLLYIYPYYTVNLRMLLMKNYLECLTYYIQVRLLYF